MAKIDLRKYKRRINWYMKKVRIGSHFLDCRFHPCVATEVNYWTNAPFDSEINGTSLIDGGGASCSCIYCGPEPISKERAEELKAFYEQYGEDAYMVEMGWTAEGWEHFKKEWRSEKINAI